MILTVTLNPAVDISYGLEEFKIDTVNRVSDVRKTAGGKGLNVTRVLAELGERVLATGLAGGTNGEFITDQIQLIAEEDFYLILEDSRNCIAILHEGNQTEILEDGPKISIDEEWEFRKHFKNLLKDFDTVVFSGSLPKGLPQDYYARLMQNTESRNVVLDTSGSCLKEVLLSSYKPTVIKPNKEELEQLLGVQIADDIEELKTALNNILFDGIEWIIVSLGKDGAFAKHGSTFYRVEIPKIKVVNPVGSGDSTVAGIASALHLNEKDEVLLKKAMALGMLNAQEKQTGHVNMTKYESLFNQVRVREV